MVSQLLSGLRVMHEFLQKLYIHDSKIQSFSTEKNIIEQGLAPLLSLNNTSIHIQKANLLEQAKYINWKNKSTLFFNALNKQNIKFLIFKGFSYSFLLYHQTHLRPYADIDILIDKNDYDTVASILTQQGFSQYPSRQGQFVSFQNSFYDSNTPKTIFDLHWQINNRIEFHQHFRFDTLYRESQTISTDDFKFQTLNLETHFIVAIFHYFAHQPADRKHIWLYDVALLWKAMDNTQQQNCLSLAKLKNQSTVLTAGLNILEETFKGIFNFGKNLTQQQKELTEYYLKPKRRKIIDIGNKLTSIKGLSHKLKFLSEYIFQTQNYVQARYQLKSKRWIFLYYPKMWFEDIFKLFK